jgi:ATP-binding cassette, subfamily D (ALD), peroxisomal long-chain fatty acid import protein
VERCIHNFKLLPYTHFRITSYRELLELAGLTTRLYTLLSTLHQLPPLPPPGPADKSGIVLHHVDVGVPKYDAEEEEKVSTQPPLVRDLSLALTRGEHL